MNTKINLFSTYVCTYSMCCVSNKGQRVLHYPACHCYCKPPVEGSFGKSLPLTKQLFSL